ncbi:putative ABC transport system ATP-binding protein [Trichlorobacter thiogenes]|uniref:Putative ABC transport system ATP-binding protein n=1 Tax=Trichlorobacter thiogenes TaxID=115783 RepID=A0A1T4MIT2_9BACT|nr:ABC transporter ATP-binding protein [Trichlorobacter thiogenes]SJZ66755.1 putative ABC transport system ATP-binding protein [Trichlorobacter thiogenes]
MITTSNVTKNYPSGAGNVAALKGVDLTVETGEFVCIMGQSGSGKSTLLTILGGMCHPSAGSVEVDGAAIYSLNDDGLADFRAGHFGFVFQSFHLVPYLTALENVMLPLAPLKMSALEKQQLASDALTRVGLADCAGRLPSRLSGGEQERVAIARAVVNRPAILFADEPTGNLDSATSDQVMGLFAELHQAGQTIVMVTHNPDNGRYAQRTIRLKDGLLDTPDS